MFETLLLDAVYLTTLLHVVSPAALRATFRLPARCNPRPLSLAELPAEARSLVDSVLPALDSLQFAFAGCYDLGEVAAHTRKMAVCFSNRESADSAAIHIITAANSSCEHYLEFTTCFSNGVSVDTNTNDILPVAPENPAILTFRFPEVGSPAELYQLHRRLAARHAAGAWPRPELKGEEILRIAKLAESFGPRLAESGYTRHSAEDDSYRLTWKGACLMAWRKLWPTSLLRRALYRQEMRNEVAALEVRGVAALQKA